MYVGNNAGDGRGRWPSFGGDAESAAWTVDMSLFGGGVGMGGMVGRW